MGNHILLGNPNKLNYILIGLVLANLCITLPLAFWLNIWFDEAYSLNAAHANFEEMLHQTLFFGKQPPVYQFLLHFWLKINHSFWFARLISVIAISFTIYITAFISKRLIPDINPTLASALIAFHPFSIWAATEIRLYAFAILLSALLTLLFLDAYFNASPRVLSKFLYVLVAILACYTYYPLAFLLVANAAVLFLSRHRQELRNYILGMLVILLFLIPLLFLVYKQLQIADTCELVPPAPVSWALGLKTVGRGILYHLFPIRGTNPQPLSTSWRIVLFVMIALLLGFIIKNRSSIRHYHLSLWLMFILSSFILSVGIAINRFNDIRYTAAIFIFCLLSLVSILALMLRKQKKYIFIWLVIIIGFYLGSFWGNYAPMAKNGDYEKVATYIESHKEDNQPVILFNPEVSMTFSYHYKGSNQLIALPQTEDFKTWDWCDHLLQDEMDIEGVLSRLPKSQTSTMWLIVDTGILPQIPLYKKSYQIIDNFLKKNYQVEESLDFYGSNLKLLRRK